MKTTLMIAISLAFATAVVRGQDLPTYQSTVSGQSPIYYNQLDRLSGAFDWHRDIRPDRHRHRLYQRLFWQCE